jgi:drug/metabolite transporter (DMT)-like permease
MSFLHRMTSGINAGGKLRTALYTSIALVAFAGNSILCRLALGQAAVDAATFSAVRLISGAITLGLITRFSQPTAIRESGTWLSAAMLFLYAVPFSFAYISLTTGTGALILFGCVQVTMIVSALWSGERPHPLQWLGLAVALAGLVYLVFPGLAAPSPRGSGLMAIAGVAWGVYSLLGRGAKDPLAQTAANFIRSVPFVLGVSLLSIPMFSVSTDGFLLAIASGALASGLGYVIWYLALRGLTTTRSAVVQLAVPVLAAAGGVMFMSETISMRLLLSATTILGGVGLALIGRERHAAPRA